ncbi:MAG TPA: RNA polymerase sigma factor [Caulobacteraceae bacterium]|nr:RNA polymerase sigma factor [Caulobacteraceae bacterium]
MTAQTRLDYEALSDPDLAAAIGRRDSEAARLLVRRNNQRLFRAAWSILRCRGEAEDVVQEAYARAFAAIGRFDGRSSLSTWLTRIAINEALGRRRADLRRRARLDRESVVAIDEYREKFMRGSLADAPPDAELARLEIRRLVEAAVARLPDEFRLVFVLREIEGLGVEEVARMLDLVPATVKTRSLRARRKLQEMLDPELKTALTGAFPFAGIDCEGLTERVMAAFEGSG